jgi:hypothetical protein
MPHTAFPRRLPGRVFSWFLPFMTLAVGGCGAHFADLSWPVPSRAKTRAKGPAEGAGKSPHGKEAPESRSHRLRTSATAFIEDDLRAQGLRFGTDGSPGALFGYLRSQHEPVPPARARAGDLVFFALGGPDQDCGDHVGLVESARDDGALTFREVRDGRVHHSVAHPTRPRIRRDERGRIVNSFLRPIRADDPRGSRYFAGDMLCAAIRIQKGR